MDFDNLLYLNEDKINTIFVLTTRWGAYFGGINVFNYEMCRTLGEKYKNKQIYCFVNEANENELQDAIQNNIQLVPIPDYKDVNIKNYSNKENLFPDIIIGHDIFTGEIANKCKNNIKNSISAVILHHAYHLYGALKGKSGEETDNKKILQREILREADIVFTVGPKLFNSLKDYRINNGIELNPGCFKTNIEIFPEDNLGDRGNRIMGSGRLSNEDNHIKQSELLKNAFIEYSKDKRGDHILYLLGLDDSEINNLCKINLKDGNNIITKKFTNDREGVFDTIAEQSLFVMPSRHEGFGLTGLEAITMGIPLIISTNSGLYEQLSSHPDINDYYISLEIVNDENINKTNLVNALNEFNSKKSEYKKKALKLRDYFNQNITWELLVKKIIDKSSERIKIEPIFPIKNEMEINHFIENLKKKSNNNRLKLLESICNEILGSKNLKKELHFGKILRGMIVISKLNIDIEETLTEQYEESKGILFGDLIQIDEDFLKNLICNINDLSEELSFYDKYSIDYLDEYSDFEEINTFLENEIHSLKRRKSEEEELSLQIDTHEKQELGPIGYDLEEFDNDYLDKINEILSKFENYSNNLLSKKSIFENNEDIYNKLNDLDCWYKDELRNKLIDNPFNEYLNEKNKSTNTKDRIYSDFCLKIWDVIKH